MSEFDKFTNNKRLRNEEIRAQKKLKFVKFQDLPPEERESAIGIEEVEGVPGSEVEPRNEDSEVEGEEGSSEGEDWGGGFKVEPFNLRKERREGSFDDDGFFLERRGRSEDVVINEDGEKDVWLEELEEQIEKYKKEGRQYIGKPKKNNGPAFDEGGSTDGVQLRQKLHDLLLPNETPSAALRRLSSKKRKERTKKEQEDFDTVTECADQLLNSGFYSVYDETKEKIQASLGKLSSSGPIPTKAPSKAARPPPKKVDKYAQTKWEYKAAGGIQGPFTTQEMREWWNMGWFQGDQAVEMREVKQKEESIYEDIEEKEEPWVSSATLGHIFSSS